MTRVGVCTVRFHTRNFSLEGFPFFLGIAIYCFEVSLCEMFGIKAMPVREMVVIYTGIYTLIKDPLLYH